MPISVKCHGCSKILRISDDVAGLRFRCNACGTILLAPSQEGGKGNIASAGPKSEETRTDKNQREKDGKSATRVRRRKRKPNSNLSSSQADTDWNEIIEPDQGERHESPYQKPTSPRTSRKAPKHLSKVFITIGIVLVCIVAIPLAIRAVRSIRWAVSGHGIVCNSPPFGNRSGSVQVPDTWRVASVSRRIDDSGVRILFEDHAFSDHPESRTIFELSVIHLSPGESELSLFRADGQLDVVAFGYTGSGFPGAMTLSPPEGESYSTSYRNVDEIEFTRISWSTDDSIVREGQLVRATTNCFAYWGRRDDILILMAGGYTASNLSVLNPADAIAGTLRHDSAEAFVPAIGVRASDFPKPEDIPRHVLKTLDEF